MYLGPDGAQGFIFLIHEPSTKIESIIVKIQYN